MARAKPQNLVLLGKDFPKLKLIKLEQNYRSSQRILRAANILIANNPHVYDKSLFSELAYGEPMRVLFAANEEQEAERVVAEIIRLSLSVAPNLVITRFCIGVTTSLACLNGH